MKTKTVKTLIPLEPSQAWEVLIAPEFPPLFSQIAEIRMARWVGNYLLTQSRIPGGMSVNIARVKHPPHRVEIAARSGRVWICLFDRDPLGTIWTAWIEGDFTTNPPAGFTTEDRDWLNYYNVLLDRWSEAVSSIGWILTENIPEDMHWTLD